jgi:O-antigen biosynthesis protein WbqP
MKYRLLDLFLILLLVVPIVAGILVIATIVVVVDRHNPFFVSRRVGYHQKPFNLYKIRTMVVGAPVTATNDKMSTFVTPLGSYLRRLSLDELPQVLNILCGDMSWVGPRPCLNSEKELILLRRENKVFDVPPGITGLAQINGRDALTVHQKVTFDAKYACDRSLALNAKILINTLLCSGFDKNVNY